MCTHVVAQAEASGQTRMQTDVVHLPSTCRIHQCMQVQCKHERMVFITAWVFQMDKDRVIKAMSRHIWGFLTLLDYLHMPLAIHMPVHKQARTTLHNLQWTCHKMQLTKLRWHTLCKVCTHMGESKLQHWTAWSRKMHSKDTLQAITLCKHSTWQPQTHLCTWGKPDIPGFTRSCYNISPFDVRN